jgi:hypothetical protein
LQKEKADKPSNKFEILSAFSFCGEGGILALASDFVDYEPPLRFSHPL